VAAGTTLDEKVTDGSASATIHLFVKYAGQFSTSPSAYALTSDNPRSSGAGTLFQLASGSARIPAVDRMHGWQV
jgi:hypothetical protein